LKPPKKVSTFSFPQKSDNYSWPWSADAAAKRAAIKVVQSSPFVYVDKAVFVGRQQESAAQSEIATVIKWLWLLGVRAENLKQTSPEEEEAAEKEEEEHQQQRRLCCFCFAAREREGKSNEEHAALSKKKGGKALSAQRKPYPTEYP